jgi:hypothetical protein
MHRLYQRFHCSCIRVPDDESSRYQAHVVLGYEKCIHDVNRPVPVLASPKIPVDVVAGAGASVGEGVVSGGVMPKVETSEALNALL